MNLFFKTTVVSLLLVLSVAHAGRIDHGAAKATDPAHAENAAEAQRIADEILKLARRRIWTGVERKYNQLIELNQDVGATVHLTAAYSARESGNLLLVYERLLRAAKVKPSREVVDWLWDLDHNYGRVELVVDRRRTAELKVDNLPLDPNRRKVIETAITICKDKGSFTGLLPRNTYVFAGQEFTVEPGISVRVEVSPKMRRQGLVEPTIVYQELPTAVGNEE
ncbi:MAG: hypothetical protein CL930_14345 [Deltaproteobacteria bacterium]|nr:hypothetical protein [Deltaproteobacteria bacterium]